MKRYILLEVEDALNCHPARDPDRCVPCAEKVNPQIVGMIDQHLSQPTEPPEPTIYEDVIFYIKRMKDPRYLRKNGGIKEAAFYQYAYIDKSTWSELKWNQVRPSKKTVLKLILALELSENEAEALMAKAHCGFDTTSIQDQVIQALIHLRAQGCALDVDEVIEVLDYYRENGPKPFISIYDTPEMVAERKKQDGEET